MGDIQKNYDLAKEVYAEYGVDNDEALVQLTGLNLSIHCWQGDAVGGFETPERLPGSNETMKVVLGEQQQHEEEGCPPIPAEVIDALMAARETAESNMFARQAVMKIISDLDEYPAAVLWLYDNERRYIEAMDAMGERLAAERGA